MSLLLLWLRLQRRPRSPRRRVASLPPPRQQSPSLVLLGLDAIAVCEEVVENVTETKLASSVLLS
jgi:hypothetical protein